METRSELFGVPTVRPERVEGVNAQKQVHFTEEWKLLCQIIKHKIDLWLISILVLPMGLIICLCIIDWKTMPLREAQLESDS